MPVVVATVTAFRFQMPEVVGIFAPLNSHSGENIFGVAGLDAGDGIFNVLFLRLQQFGVHHFVIFVDLGFDRGKRTVGGWIIFRKDTHGNGFNVG